MGKCHVFDVTVAENYGVNAAIILYNIANWIEKNKANEKNYIDGKYWTYNSIKAFKTQFPYMSEKVIRGALQKLIEGDVIVTGNYNKSQYDRTLWYALTEKGEGICLFGKMDITKNENGNLQNGEPIPYKNTYINTNIISSSKEEDSPDFEKSDIQKVVEAWNSLCLNKVTKLTPNTDRFTMLKKRIKDYGIDSVLSAIENVKASKFLNGNNSRGFVCTFDWFLKPNNFPKVLDGNYNNDSKKDIDHRAYEGAIWLSEKIGERVSDFKAPSRAELDRWASDIDELHNQGYTWRKISDTALWALNDKFWCSVIVSGEALRKNFVKLLSKEAAECD